MTDFLAKVVGAVTVTGAVGTCILEPAVLVILIVIFGVLYLVNPKI
jgi:hypothetical protein